MGSRVLGSRVRERSHGPPELPSRRVGSSSCRRSMQQAEVRVKDCFRGGAPFGARRHVPLPGRVCPVLPPTMSARCAMTCPSMRTPLGEPDCVFLWSTGRRSQLRADVLVIPATARGSANDRAVQARAAKHHSIGEHPMPHSATSRPTISDGKPTGIYRRFPRAPPRWSGGNDVRSTAGRRALST